MCVEGPEQNGSESDNPLPDPLLLHPFTTLPHILPLLYGARSSIMNDLLTRWLVAGVELRLGLAQRRCGAGAAGHGGLC